MSKILYPIFNLPNENDAENEGVPTWIKWWLLNNYKKSHSWVLSEIIAGNPLLLENSVETKFYLPPLPRGNSEQVQYSGKNKLNNTSLTEQKTTNGITATPNADGSVTLNGTSTATTFINLSNTQNFGETNFSSASNVNDNYKAILINGTGYASLNYTYDNLTTAIRISSGITINNITMYPMILLKSETNETYEPYVGGTASPNPSYPQPINNVTGDVEVLVQNKNLFELLDLVKLSDEYSQSGNGYTFSSKQSMYSTGVELDKPLELPISFSYKIKNGTGQNFRLRFWFDDGTAQAMNAYSSGTGTSEVLITANNITKTGATKITKIGADFSNQYTTYTITDFIINYGTTTTYTPHKEQTFTFPLGTQRMYLGDYLADDGIHHVRKQIELTAENVDNLVVSKSVGYDTNRVYLYKTSLGWKSSWTAGVALINNYSEAKVTTDIASGKFSLNNGFTTLEIYDERFTDLATARQLMIGTIIEIQQANEWIETYTTEQQQAYNEIKQAISYEEQTNISGTSSEAEPIFEVQYYMKNESEGE